MNAQASAIPVIDASEYDGEPHRSLLVGTLLGVVVIRGSESQPELDALAAQGLVTAPELLPSNDAGADHVLWMVRGTPAGECLGLSLATSAELVTLLDVAARLHRVGLSPWGGVGFDAVTSELDRRLGGSGRITDPQAWLHEHTRSELQDLPRPLDRGPP